MLTFQRRDPAQLQAQIAQMKGGSFNEADGKEWKLQLDSAKNGSAVIRFLPGRTPESMPFVKLVNHGFKVGSKWYIENCTSTHGDFESCPVCAHIKENDLFNTDNAKYQQMKRKTSYWANILVIKDPACPENENKVFKYRFGQKVMDKINAMIEVDTSMGETPVDIFCAMEGANFVLKVKQVGGFSNYDESKFLGVAPIAGIETEEVQKKLIDEMLDIDAIAAKDQFNDFDKNNESFRRVLGTAALGGAASEASRQADGLAAELEDFDKQMSQFTANEQAAEPAKVEVEKPAATAPAGDSLDDLLGSI